MYIAYPDRYKNMTYNKVGNSGLKLPQLSLGLWQNFGNEKDFEHVKEIILAAFDAGITHFDLANNYGRPFGSAEENLGKILSTDLLPYRDELIISTKAGYPMWDGPYGDGGSRKYIFASLHQSLKRLQLDYVDIFYHHRPDYNTPLEETMKALAGIVHQGKALYIGLSNYPTERAVEAQKILKSYGVELLIHQPRFNMLERWVQETNLDTELEQVGVGMIPFSILKQGILTGKYSNGIPSKSRAADKDVRFLQTDQITQDLISKSVELSKIAESRQQTLAEMSIAWVCAQQNVSSVLLGVSKLSQLHSNLKSIKNMTFTKEELDAIDSITKS